MLKTVVVIGSGGRESALVEKYSQSQKVGQIIAIPGNDMMSLVSKKPVRVYPEITTTEKYKILKICEKEKVDLIDVAQDNAIAAGVVDTLKKRGYKVIGPTKSAGKIEWSKKYSRILVKKLNISQPEFKVFKSVEDGIKFLNSQKDQPWFVKADGLASGKGALPAANNKTAQKQIRSLKQFGESGKIYLLEKWLKSEGKNAEEFSAFALSDGKTYQVVSYAQDHKRVFDNDMGENTGGMGASTPPLVVSNNIKKQVNEVFEKIFTTISYTGVLYLGGILIGEKVYVMEFNARWGDPEAQIIIPSIKNDLYELSSAIATGKLNKLKITTDKKARVVIAGAAVGYPGNEKKVFGKEITGIEKLLKDKNIKFYGSGIKIKNNKFYVNGGRLFYIVGKGKNVVDARKMAYDAMKKIKIEGNNLHYRRDIGYRDVNRLKHV